MKYFCLYRSYTKRGRLLYIGCSMHFLLRLAKHSVVSKWFKHVSRIDICKYPTLAKARKAEKEAIERERPAFNQLGSYRNHYFKKWVENERKK